MKKLLIANFKSNKSVKEANDWLAECAELIDWNSLGNYEVGVAPSFISTASFSNTIKELNIPLKLTTQDISSFPAGGYTGAISFRNLAGLNISYAIVGHSERRQYFAETPKMVAQKVEQALENEITPLVCIDEPYLEEQITAIDSSLLSKCIFVYEPLAAIGTGKSVSVDNITNIKKQVEKLCGKVMFMYGGSVTDQNAAEYLLVSDGFIIGGFAVKASDFASLVAVATK